MKLLITNKAHIFNKLKRICRINCNNANLSHNSQAVVYLYRSSMVPITFEDITGNKLLSISDLPLPQGCWSEKVGEDSLEPVKKFCNSLTELYHVGDIDLPSQYLVDQFIDCLPVEKGKVKRAWFFDATEESLLIALQNPVSNSEFNGLSLIEKTISEIDWVFGMTTSTMFSYLESLKNHRYYHSMGRVKTQILAEVAESIKNKELREKNYGLKIKVGATEERPAMELDWVPDATYVNESGKFSDFSFITQMKEHFEDKIQLVYKTGKARQVPVTPPELLTKNKLLALLTKGQKVSFDQAWYSIVCIYEKGYISNPNTSCAFLSSGQREQVISMLNKYKEQQNDQSAHLDSENLRDAIFVDDNNFISAIVPTQFGIGSIGSMDGGIEEYAFKIILNHFLAQFSIEGLDQIETFTYASTTNNELFNLNKKTTIEMGWRRLFTTNPKEDVFNPPDLVDSGIPVVTVLGKNKSFSVSDVFERFSSSQVNVIGALKSLLNPKKQYLETHRGMVKPTKTGWSLFNNIQRFGNPVHIAQKAYQDVIDDKDPELALKKFNIELTKYVKQFNKEVKNMMQGAKKCYECSKGYMIKVEVKDSVYYRCSTFPSCRNTHSVKSE